MNEVVALHRQAVPNDSRTDSQISLLYGDANPALLQQYPQFAQDYQSLAAQRKEDLTPSLGQEFASGVSRGVSGLEATGEGALALGAGYVGADSLKNYFLQKAQANQEEAAASPPSVASISDAKNFSDYAHYFASKAGELVPNIGEAAVTSAAGAAIGSMVGTAAEPGGGTAVGGAGGFLYGLIRSRAMSKLINDGVMAGVEDLAEPAIAKQVADLTLNLGKTYGTHIFNTANFWAQSAGSTYNTLSKDPNVDPGTALNVSLLGGLAQAIPSQYLPSYITKKFFGEAAPSVNGYFARLASEAAKVIPGGAAAMDLQELASIASEKYADPATRSQAFDLGAWTKEDRSRLINAAATGSLAGLLGAPIAAIPKGEATPLPEVKSYTGEQSQQDAQRMAELARKEASGTLSVDDKVLIDHFSVEQRNQLVLAKSKFGEETSGRNPAAPPEVPGWQSRDIESGIHSDPVLDQFLEVTKAGSAPLPDRTGAYPPVTDEDMLKALAPKPPEPTADQPATPPPVQAGSAAPVAPVAPAAPSPALAAARSASVAALDPEAQETRARVADAATQATVTPPTHATPTIEKPRVVIGGIPIAMENAAGSTRSAKQGDWQVQMPAHYGEIIGSKGADGDPIDVYIGPKPEGDKVFVVDQANADTGKFDEHKVMLGFDSQHEAQAAYDAAFSDGKGVLRRSKVTETTKEGLRQWLEKGDHTKRFGEAVENTGTTGIPGQNQDEPKVHEKVLDRAGKIGSENIDFDNSNIVAQESAAGKNRGKAGAGETTKFEPSYFDIKPGELEDHKALGERLVSGARSSDQKRAYQDSRRVTAVQDNQTGKVFLLGTYKEKTDGSVKLADPDKVGQRNSNTRLGDILAQKTEDGKQRYTPFASMRLNEVKRSFVQEYASRAAFDKDIGEDARQRMGTMADHAQSIEELHDAGLKERGINLPGDSTDEEHEDETPETAAPEAKAEEGFTGAHADALWNVFGGEEEPLTRERFEELFSSDLPKSRSAVAALKVAVLHEMDANKLSPIDALEIVKNKLYGSLEEGDRSGKGAFKESAIQSLGPAATEQPSGGRDETAKALEASIRQRATEQQSKSAEGNAVVNNPSVLKFRKPEGVTEVTEQHSALLDSIHKAAVDGGMNVQRIGQDLSGLSGEFAKNTGASYDRASRTVAQVVGDVIGREDVVTSFHEVGHDLFARLPEHLQQRVLSAIDKLSDRQAGVDISSDPRIRSENPTGMSAGALAEERLVEATALHLTDEGFSPQASKGYAQAFVRGLKDLYLRAAMSVQRALFGDDFTNPLLAQRFFENRMKQFLAGDFTRTSFLDMIGGGKPSQAKAASWHATGATLFERIGSDGKVEYGHTPDTSLDASRLNNLVFRKPEMPAEDQKTAIEIRSALFNHQLEMFGKAAQSPEILTAAREAEQTGDTYLLKTLRLADPMAMKTELENGLAEAKSGIQYDHTKTIDQFKDASNSDRAARDAYVNAQALQSKVSARKSQAVETYSDLADKREKVLQKYEEQKANYADWQGSTTEAARAMRQEGNKLFASISGESKKLGGIEQQLKAIDPNADIKKYAPAFQRLFTGEQLKGERLFNVLDKLANDPKIDFTQPINKIRDALSADPAYADFVQDTNESRALTATIVAFAKTHSQVMANLELRRAASGEERVGIVKRLDDLKSEKTNFLTNLRDLARNAKLEDRVRQSYRNALLDVRSINRRMDNAKAQIAAADALSPVISKEQARLAEKLAIGTTTTFGDGAEYAVPLSKGASTAELMKPRAAGTEFQHPIGWQINKLVLDTTDRSKLSNPEVVEQHLRQMAEFLNEREARFDAGDLGAKDTAYQGVKNAFEEIAANKNFNLKVAPSERFLAELRVLGEGQKVEDAFGTPTARAIGQMVRHETDEIQRMHPQAERIWRRNEQLEDELIKLLPGKMADKRNTLRSDFLNPAKKTMQGQRELAEIHAGNPTALKSAIYNRVMDKLLSSKATAQYVKGNEAKWRAGLQNLLEFQHDANKYFESQARGEGDRAMTLFGRQVATGHGVADERLKATNPATGKVETATRKPIPVGPYTFAQKMSQGFKNMVNALRNSGWIANDENGQARSLAADDFGKIAEAYNKGDHKQVAALTQKYFNHPQYGDAVRNNFFRSLAEMDTESPFQAPTKADAITSFPADIAKVHEAYQRAGDDPIAFFELLHQLHGGEGDAGQYIQSQMLRLADLAKESHSIMEKIEPTGTDRDVSVRGMTSDYALNARRIDHLPGEWFDYHSFDAADSYAITKRIAAQNAYGPGGERLGNAFDSLKNEVTQAQYKLRQAQEEVRRANPTADQKTMAKLVTAKVGGEAEYKRLTQFNKRSSLIAESVKALSSYHRRDNTPDGTLNFFVRAAHAIGSLMINQPSSAISLLTQLTDVNLRYGASRSVIGASLRGVASAGKEIAGSLAQAVGLSIFNGGEFANRYREMGFNDPASIRKFTDSFGRLDHEGRGAHFFRIAQDALGTPVNRLGDKATHVPFRPLQPFDTVGSVVDQKITEMVWQLASQHLARGQEFYRNNLDKLNDPKFKLTPESLGLKGASKDSFERFTGDMTRWNLNYDDMVRNGMQRGDKTLFTNQEAARLYSMAVSEIALRGNLANFSAAWNNNSLLRIAAPLMAWSFRRMVQVGSLRLNADGQNNMAAFARGVAGLSLAAGGGIAVSAMLDQYYQKLVGKERNLRPIIGAPDLQQAGLGLMEDLSRVGTFGMFGELANSIIGSGQSGDNRALSVDQRVLAISSLQSVLQAADNWVNQGYNVDYSHVVRPLMGAMGGGALIQYMQLANNALGLDNVEARVTARINAQNYLRVVGRELGMEVKSDVGGSGTPTEITPYFTAMELAAYKNSAGDFREAYNNAVMAAKKLGQEDPVEYVKRSFATRNPLKQVFQTVPSQYDYERLLANMPGSGNQDVSQAVRLFNQYGAMIGIKPFDGKVEKPQPIAKVMSDYRQRSALALQ